MNKSPLFLIIFVLISCATQYKRVPTGGAKDTVSPFAISSYPVKGAINQSSDLTIKIDFSEYIKYSSTKNGISISPFSAKNKSEIEWGEDNVTVKFSNLDTNKTVLVIANSTITDLRRNPLKDNFILNFSTGSKLDSGAFRGDLNYSLLDNRLASMPLNKVKVFLYKKDSILTNKNPEYVITANKDGLFDLNYMQYDDYISLLFFDKNGNNKLDLSANEVFTTGNAFINSGNKTREYNFTLGRIDTIAPYIKSVIPIYNNILKVIFSEPISNSIKTIDSIFACDKKIEGKEYFRKNSSYTYLKIDSLTKIKEITLYSASLTDTYMNKITKKLRKRTLILPDSVLYKKLKILNQIPKTFAIDDTLNINLNTFENNNIFVELKNKNYNDTLSLTAKTPFLLKTAFPTDKLKEGFYYLLIRNNADNDTLYYNNIKFSQAKGFGTVSGEIIGNYKNKIILFNEVKDDSNDKTLLLNGNSKFIQKLHPGKYLISVYNDLDRNNHYSPGNISFLDKNSVGDDFFAEKITTLKDTIVIRKNWETSKIKIKL